MIDTTGSDRAISRRGYVATLAVIAVLAYSLRLYAVPFGYPLSTHPDEPRVVGIALEMARSGELNPGFFNYGSLTFYLLAALFKIDMAVHGPSEVADIHYYVLGRIFVATLGMATILATAETARLLCGRLAGLAAAALLGASLLHCANSFTVTVDVPATFWSALSLLVAAHGMRRGPRLAHFAGAGALAGLAIATKYIAWPALLPIAILNGRHARGWERWFSPRLGLAFCTAGIAFLVAMPYAVLDTFTFATDLTRERFHYSDGSIGGGPRPPRAWSRYAGNLVLEGWGVLPSVLSLAGLAWLLRKDPWKTTFAAVVPVALLAFVGSYRVWFARNLTGALPGLAILGGGGPCTPRNHSHLPGQAGVRADTATRPPGVHGSHAAGCRSAAACVVAPGQHPQAPRHARRPRHMDPGTRPTGNPHRP
jgi:4-amino-4-deoxy-L-arabinose transferase-like glycosyltransferase